MKKETVKKRFTLIELLVVIAIIAILAGILLPTLSMARERGRAIASANNCKQWGTGYMMAADDYNERVPWDGEDTLSDIYSTTTDDLNEVWLDIVPPYVGQAAFKDFGTDKDEAGKKFHGNSIFSDPSARNPDGTEDDFDKWDSNTQLFTESSYYHFFSYVPNSKVDGSSEYYPYDTEKNIQRVKLNQIKYASATVLLLEKRTSASEITGQGLDDKYADKSVNRLKANWKRVAARHNKGAYLVFADGHVSHMSYSYMLTKADPDYIDGDKKGYNKQDIIWDPLGRAD